jgi:hypothetical protein
LRESSCFAALRFTHLELFLVRILITYAPIVGVFSFFSPGAPTVFLREGCTGNITPCSVLAVVQITSFLPSARGLEFPLFDGDTRTLLQSQW